jgi:hypothetical protein
MKNGSRFPKRDGISFHVFIFSVMGVRFAGKLYGNLYADFYFENKPISTEKGENHAHNFIKEKFIGISAFIYDDVSTENLSCKRGNILTIKRYYQGKR